MAFDPDEPSLKVVAKSEATGAHSWLSLNADRTRLYATAWTSPPGLAAYKINKRPSSPPTLSLLNSVPTQSRSGYCCNSSIAVYSAGGPTGEVFKIDPRTGGFEQGKEGLLQELNFVDSHGQTDDGGVMDFGGLRHGAHSADLSIDGKRLYIADIGRSCIFVYDVAEDGTLQLTDKNIAPRPNDGPRHVTPHPNGRYVYSLQEHTSMVDVFEVSDDGKLTWKQGVKIIPSELSPSLFWADEVRLSPTPSSSSSTSSSSSSSPLYLYASTRGLEPTTLGYISIFRLTPSGLFDSESPLTMYQTPTSGGWANAIEPAPLPISSLGSIRLEEVEEKGKGKGRDYLAWTDSEQGLVLILSWDGEVLKEVARTKLEDGAGAATAVWVD